MTPTFTLAYKLAWLPRMLLAGRGLMSAFPAAPIMQTATSGRAAGTRRALFLGDFSAVANRRCPQFCGAFRELCRSADIVIANCESPVAARSIMPVQTRLGFCHAMDEGLLPQIFDAAAIDPEKLIVSLANNHVADQGRKGVEGTVAALQAMRITPVGLRSAGPSAWETVTIGGARVACLAFTQWIDRDAGLFSDMIRSGAPAEIDDDQPNEADFACVLPHWGCEFRFRPDEAMRRLAARFAAAGADVVAGTHPHVVQPLEKIDATLIAYSLGDFLGSVLARSPWPLRLMMALAIDFAPDRAQGSRVIGHEAHVFFRMRRDGRERIEQIDALPVAERARAERLAMRVLGGDRSVRGTNLASEPLTS